MPNHFLLLTGGKIVNIRNLKPKPMAGFVMPIGSLHETGLANYGKRGGV